MSVYVFGEAHVEYAMVLETLLKNPDKILLLLAKAKPDEDFMVSELINRFSNKKVLTDYLSCINNFKVRIKEFYEPLKELVGRYNTLFIEGSYTTMPGVLESHLKTRGLSTSLFDEVIDLDRSKTPLEPYWREKIVDNLVGKPSDGNVFIKVGNNHVDRLELSSKVVIHKMDASFMTEEFMLDAAFIKELTFR